jgi:hypothetical protein
MKKESMGIKTGQNAIPTTKGGTSKEQIKAIKKIVKHKLFKNKNYEK